MHHLFVLGKTHAKQIALGHLTAWHHAGTWVHAQVTWGIKWNWCWMTIFTILGSWQRNLRSLTRWLVDDSHVVLTVISGWPVNFGHWLHTTASNYWCLRVSSVISYWGGSLDFKFMIVTFSIRTTITGFGNCHLLLFAMGLACFYFAFSPRILRVRTSVFCSLGSFCWDSGAGCAARRLFFTSFHQSLVQQ